MPPSGWRPTSTPKPRVSSASGSICRSPRPSRRRPRTALAAARKIGLDEANDLIGFQKAFVESVVASELEERIGAIELALAKANLNLGIAVEGGLPTRPGAENVIMPAQLLPAFPHPSKLPPHDNGGGES